MSAFVRTLPQRQLGDLLHVCEVPHALIELCTFLALEPGDPVPSPSSLIPAGKQPVPIGWADNLADASATELYDVAQRLNFHRAAKWAEGQIAAKKMVAPIQQMGIDQVLPLVSRLLDPIEKRLAALQNSTPSALSSSA